MRLSRRAFVNRAKVSAIRLQSHNAVAAEAAHHTQPHDPDAGNVWLLGVCAGRAAEAVADRQFLGAVGDAIAA